MFTESDLPYEEIKEESKRREGTKFSEYQVSKGYAWIILSVLGGICYGLIPVILGKSSIYGCKVLLLFGPGALLYCFVFSIG